MSLLYFENAAQTLDRLESETHPDESFPEETFHDIPETRQGSIPFGWAVVAAAAMRAKVHVVLTPEQRTQLKTKMEPERPKPGM